MGFREEVRNELSEMSEGSLEAVVQPSQGLGQEWNRVYTLAELETIGLGEGIVPVEAEAANLKYLRKQAAIYHDNCDTANFDRIKNLIADLEGANSSRETRTAIEDDLWNDVYDAAKREVLFDYVAESDLDLNLTYIGAAADLYEAEAYPEQRARLDLLARDINNSYSPEKESVVTNG